MTPSEVLSILTEAETKRLMGRGQSLLCNFCEELIQPGEYMVRKRNAGHRKTRNATRYYHEKCWKRLLH